MSVAAKTKPNMDQRVFCSRIHLFSRHSVTNTPSTDCSESSEKVSTCMQCHNAHVLLVAFCELTSDPVCCSTTEGVRRLFSGATMASSRGALVTVGQVSSALLLVHSFSAHTQTCSDNCASARTLSLVLLLKAGNTKVVGRP